MSDMIWLASCEKVATRKKKSKMRWKQSNVAMRNSWIQWLKSWHNSWLMDQCTTQLDQLSKKKWRVIKRADSVSFLETAHRPSKCPTWSYYWRFFIPKLFMSAQEAKTSFYFLHSVIEAIHDSAFAYQTSNINAFCEFYVHKCKIEQKSSSVKSIHVNLVLTTRQTCNLSDFTF